MTDTPKTLFGARIGDRVQLRDGHPWAGYTGRVVSFESWMGKPTLAVQLDGSEQRAGVIYRNDIEVLPLSKIVLTREFRPHRRAPYCNQRASCGCIVYGSMMGETMGELCERRLTGPRCDRTEDCARPMGHTGACENNEVRYG